MEDQNIIPYNKKIGYKTLKAKNHTIHARELPWP